eukprot:175476_1
MKCGMYDFVMNHFKQYNYTDILNDYHFILTNYYQDNNNCRFENMYNYICERIGRCDIYKCSHIKQLYIQDANKKIIKLFNSKEISLIELLSSIHCLIFHSFDIHGLQQNKMNTTNENEINDLRLLNINEIIQTKYDKLKHIYKSNYFKLIIAKYISNIHRPNFDDNNLNPDLEQKTLSIDDNKFTKIKKSLQNRSSSLFDGVTRTLTPRIHRSFSCDSKNDNNNDNNDNKLQLKYLFGSKFCYWLYDKKNNDPFYVKPKEKSLKDEIYKKNVLNIYEWNIIYEKAKEFMKCNNCKKLKANRGWEEKYKIHCFDDINIEHIISVIIYCNVHQFRNNFMLTFYPLYKQVKQHNKSYNLIFDNYNWIKQHSKYANFGRLLRETVECFGNAFGMKNEHEKVYYCIDSEIMFKKLKIKLYSISTTKNLYFIFSLLKNINKKGLILKLSNDKYPYYFNTNWLSLYSSENEYLFFGGNEFVNIYSIIHCNYNNNIFKDYFY